MRVGNRRASDRSGHGTHRREGANRLTYNIHEAQNSRSMSNGT
jgi:hypothetical protein